MKNLLSILFLMVAISLGAQNQILGTFAPAEDYTWLIAYHLKPGAQEYVADTPIKNGKFDMKLPEGSPTGIYRLVYAVPQDEFYLEVLYTGKETIEFNFTQENGLQFIRSKENMLFHSYFEKIQAIERRLMSTYTDDPKNRKALKAIVNEYEQTQSTFEKNAESLTSKLFITANRTYLPSQKETLETYIDNRKAHYFDHIDLSNTTLQASGFLADKLANYVFTALPAKQLSSEENESILKENASYVRNKMKGTPKDFQFSMLHSIWSQASENQYYELSNHITTFLSALGNTEEELRILADIDIFNNTRIGVIPPEISWKTRQEEKSLSAVQGAENYVLVFWSSTCGHCLKELPELHEKLKGNTKIKVIAVGLEDDDINWTKESAKLGTFEHVIALGKWESKYADLYGIKSTPTYFILDTDKYIIAKPESEKDVVAFLENH